MCGTFGSPFCCPSGGFSIYCDCYPRRWRRGPQIFRRFAALDRTVGGLSLDSIRDGVASKNVCIVVGQQRRGTNQRSAVRSVAHGHKPWEPNAKSDSIPLLTSVTQA